MKKTMTLIAFAMLILLGIVSTVYSYRLGAAKSKVALRYATSDQRLIARDDYPLIEHSFDSKS